MTTLGTLEKNYVSTPAHHKRRPITSKAPLERKAQKYCKSQSLYRGGKTSEFFQVLKLR